MEPVSAKPVPETLGKDEVCLRFPQHCESLDLKRREFRQALLSAIIPQNSQVPLDFIPDSSIFLTMAQYEQAVRMALSFPGLQLKEDPEHPESIKVIQQSTAGATVLSGLAHNDDSSELYAYHADWGEMAGAKPHGRTVIKELNTPRRKGGRVQWEIFFNSSLFIYEYRGTSISIYDENRSLKSKTAVRKWMIGINRQLRQGNHTWRLP
jgi:hypothetical protein